MLKLARVTDEQTKGQRYEITKLWANKKSMGSKCGQALLWNGYLYGNTDGGGLRCIALDGAVKWDSKVRFDLGDLIIADGIIYIIHGGNGELVMAAASPDAYKELGRAQLLSPPEPWAPLAFKDGKLVVRDMHKICCLDVTAAANGAAAH
jgi:outer membrane protein assembly factor BamB